MTSELLKRPILLGGLGLTAGAWLLQGIDPGVVHLGSTAIWTAMAVGSGFWWLKQSSKPQIAIQPTPKIDRAAVEQAFQAAAAKIDQLAEELAMPKAQIAEAAESALAEVAEPELIQSLRQDLTKLSQELDRQSLRLAVVGAQAVGKTTVAQALAQTLPAGFSLVAEATLPATADSSWFAQLADADLVLFVVCGDLTDPEFQTVQQLLQQHYRVLVAFNKQDQYLPAERPVILQQIRERLQDVIAVEDLIGISAQPAPLKVRQHLADGTVEERTEQPPSELSALQARLQLPVVEPLILATVFRQTEALRDTVQAELNQVRRRRALPVIEQYQWIAAAAAFANPVPSLDLLATATLNAQMIMDLGALYQQQFSLEQAKTVAGSLGSQMVKLGLVELASQAIAPLLKSHALTYVAGGTLQGMSAAYLTRVAGLGLVEYFEEQSQSAESGTFQLDRLLQKLQAVFQANQRSAFLQTLVNQGLSRLVPQTTAAN